MTVCEQSEANAHIPFVISLCAYIYIYISVRILIYLHLAQAGAAVTKALMDTPCLRGHCRCAGLTVSLDLAQIFLARPEGIQHCSKDGGLSV